ncbi:hypothetical protein HJC23_004869 [Cyclotella cryptica]|uniref:WW domain-containing protein n=1 Tax=Cyclotella cryptica TaxID=29204 RepID=A0ABD3PBF1_9STRA
MAANLSFEKTHALESEGTKDFEEPQMRESFQSLKIQDTNQTGAASKLRKDSINSDYSCKYDRGLTCLLSQLARINEQIQYNNSLKKVLADYDEENKRDLAASLAKSTVASGSKCCKSDGETKDSKTSNWTKYYDTAVEAEYFFNHQSGEASWLDPDAA